MPAIQSTVDLKKATYANDVGSTELSTVWSDPEFNASQHAFYYARVLEIPTPRWTTIQAVQMGVPLPDVVPSTVQERGWSSPIWYTPSADARKAAPTGMTVTDLKAKGATVLGDAQLKALIVGKAFWVRNDVTGETFSASYTVEGQANFWHIGKNASVPSGFGNVVRDGYLGTTQPYKIESGKLITYLSQDPYSVTVYKLGDTFYGARSNEFGYANYEIIPTPKFVANPVVALLNQYSDELGLTQQQREQIIPIVKSELPKLQELKKNTSLKPEQKLEQLKQISDDIDTKVTPLLDQQQQQKFQQIREEHRRQLMEKMADQVRQKTEADVKKVL